MVQITATIMRRRKIYMNTNLHYKAGSSDKVYQVQIENSGEGFVVNFQYGRKDSALSSGTKTLFPVNKEAAVKIYDKLIQSKKAKGYTESLSGTPYGSSSNENKVTGIHAQLLTPIEETQIESFLTNDNIIAEEKYDGKRLLIRKEGNKIEAINRTGLVCGMPTIISEQLLKTRKDFILDGELVGDVFYVFDILSFSGESLTKNSYLYRHTALAALNLNSTNIQTSQIYKSTEEKRNLFLHLLANNKEGIVFKNLYADYVAGRTDRQVKFKFQSEATCKVFLIDSQKRSMHLTVIDDLGNDINVGKCAIPVNKQIPKVGEFVEIRYLYFFENGSLFQPFFKSLRDDKNKADSLSSLKRKA